MSDTNPLYEHVIALLEEDGPDKAIKALCQQLAMIAEAAQQGFSVDVPNGIVIDVQVPPEMEGDYDET